MSAVQQSDERSVLNADEGVGDGDADGDVWFDAFDDLDWTCEHIGDTLLWHEPQSLSCPSHLKTNCV